MKKFSVLLVMGIFILGFSLTGTALEIEDMSEDHWAYESVQELVEKGYLSLYEDDTFKGNNKVNRYELAEIVAKLLERTQTGAIEPSEEDVGKIRELSLEFQDELVDLAEQQKAFTEEIDSVKKKNVVQDREIAETKDQVSSVQEEVTDIIDNINNIKDMNQRLTELETEVNDLRDQMEDGEAQFSQEQYKELEDKHSVTKTRVQSLQSRVEELEQQINEEETETTSDSGDKPDYKTLGALAVVTLVLIAGS